VWTALQQHRSLVKPELSSITNFVRGLSGCYMHHSLANSVENGHKMHKQTLLSIWRLSLYTKWCTNINPEVLTFDHWDAIAEFCVHRLLSVTVPIMTATVTVSSSCLCPCFPTPTPCRIPNWKVKGHWVHPSCCSSNPTCSCSRA